VSDLKRSLVTVIIIVFTCALLIPIISTAHPLVRAQDRIVINEDIVVSGDDYKVISDSLIELRGNIIVKDQATLKIINTDIFIKQDSGYQFYVYVLDSATLIIEENSRVWSGQDFAIVVCNYGRLLVKNSTISKYIISLNDGNVTLIEGRVSGIDFRDETIAEIERSSIFEAYIKNLSIVTMEKSIVEYLSCKQSVEVHIYDSTISSIDLTYLSGTLELRGCQVDGIKVKNAEKLTIIDSNITSNIIAQNTPVTIINSTVVSMSLSGYYSSSSITLSDISSLSLSDEVVLSVSSSTIGSITVTGRSMLTIVHSNVKVLYASATTSAVVEDSLVDSLILKGRCSISIRFSTINSLTCENYKGTMDFINATVKVSASFVNSNFSITGDLYAPLNISVTFSSSMVFRSFKVVALDENGNPIPNLKLKIYGENGELLCTKTSDQNGEIIVQLTFDDDNRFYRFKIAQLDLNVSCMVPTIMKLYGLDTTPPKVEIISPNKLYEFLFPLHFGKTELKFRIVDASPIANVSVYIDGMPLGTWENVDVVTLVIDSTEFSDGEHEIMVEVYDLAGNVERYKFVITFANSPAYFVAKALTTPLIALVIMIAIVAVIVKALKTRASRRASEYEAWR